MKLEHIYLMKVIVMVTQTRRDMGQESSFTTYMLRNLGLSIEQITNEQNCQSDNKPLYL
jgi:hypothetical protein